MPYIKVSSEHGHYIFDKCIFLWHLFSKLKTILSLFCELAVEYYDVNNDDDDVNFLSRGTLYTHKKRVQRFAPFQFDPKTQQNGENYITPVVTNDIFLFFFLARNERWG